MVTNARAASQCHEASTVIAAPPDIVWAVLRDAGAYGDWDSGGERVEGRIAQSEAHQGHLGGEPRPGVPGPA